jgi:hypothetical protein
MAAFLLAWNPERFNWSTLRKDIARIQRKGFVTERWSCGNRTYLPKGSDIYLIRLGAALKGIVGRGVATSGPFEGEHWDLEKRRQKIKALYVKVRFTDLRESPIIPWEELQERPLSRFKWSIFASGVVLPDPIAEELDRRWEAPRIGAIEVPRAVEDADVLAEHPFAAELAQELAILRQADLSVTEKEQLIIARRGQGIFRENVLRVEPRCRVTGVTDIAHLRASHMKPWSDCSNGERLSENNGLMLAPHVDHLFDQGYISFSDVGDIVISSECPPAVLTAWGISPSTNVRPFRVTQRPFLAYHREHVFKP